MAQAYPYEYHGKQLLKQDKCIPHCPLDKPRIWLDFNEMCDGDDDNFEFYLFSQGDVVNDSDGKDVLLYEGMEVSVYDDDEDENGMPDALLADGVLVRNMRKEYPMVKWLIKLFPTNGKYHSGNAACYWMSNLNRKSK